MAYESVQQRWWELHVRVARGDPLSVEEQAIYDAARRELEEGEVLGPLQNARQAREELRGLEAERLRLEHRRQQLDAEIAGLERTLAPQVKELLGAGE
jgi:hypothetical protein